MSKYYTLHKIDFFFVHTRLAYNESMDEMISYCLNTLTIYFIYQHICNIKGLKSKPIKHFYQQYLFRIKKLSYLSYSVYCNNLSM